MTVNEMAEETDTDSEAAETDQVVATDEVAAAEASASDEAGVDADPSPAAAAPAEAETIDAGRSARKMREGTVVSNKMDKTAVVAVVSRVRHAKYNKMILQTKKLYAHDETNDVNIGDKVRVMETRAMSKNKRWRITDVLERAK